jgi:hypothetical protein
MTSPSSETQGTVLPDYHELAHTHVDGETCTCNASAAQLKNEADCARVVEREHQILKAAEYLSEGDVQGAAVSIRRTFEIVQGGLTEAQMQAFWIKFEDAYLDALGCNTDS